MGSEKGFPRDLGKQPGLGITTLRNLSGEILQDLGLPGGPVAENLPADFQRAGNTGRIPGQGRRFHMPQGNLAVHQNY